MKDKTIEDIIKKSIKEECEKEVISFRKELQDKINGNIDCIFKNDIEGLVDLMEHELKTVENLSQSLYSNKDIDKSIKDGFKLNFVEMKEEFKKEIDFELDEDISIIKKEISQEIKYIIKDTNAQVDSLEKKCLNIIGDAFSKKTQQYIDDEIKNIKDNFLLESKKLENLSFRLDDTLNECTRLYNVVLNIAKEMKIKLNEIK